MYERLGRYELLGEIASGGMATVYLGRALGAKGFARLVAIKKLHPHLQNEEEFVAMFLDEARLAARIRHPNVVATLDVDDREGLYIVMDYVEGDRLLGLLRYAAKRGERIPQSISLRIACETLAGLHAAHELTDDDGERLNLVHRDVSPQNVLIGVDGTTKITDFGIAKAESRLSQTREGQLKGKISYMAPEQTRRSQIDRRVDIFAMGILAWEMFTGRRLFKGDNDVEVLNAVVNEPIPSSRSVTPDIPPEIDAAVMKALERNPEARWATAADFADALEEAAAKVGGMASTRVVSQYVQTVAGPKLEQERARLKAGLTLGGRQEQPSHPSEPSGQRPRRPSRITEPSTPGQTPTGQSIDLPLDLDEPPPRRRGALFALVGAGALSILALGVWLAMRSPGNPPNTSASASTNTAASAPAATTHAGAAGDPAAATGGTAAQPAPSGAGSANANTTGTAPVHAIANANTGASAHVNAGAGAGNAQPSSATPPQAVAGAAAAGTHAQGHPHGVPNHAGPATTAPAGHGNSTHGAGRPSGGASGSSDDDLDVIMHSSEVYRH